MEFSVLKILSNGVGQAVYSVTNQYKEFEVELLSG